MTDYDDDGMLPEYDFTGKKAERGRYFEAYQGYKARRQLSPDLVDRFPDSDSVNDALREYLRIKEEPA